MFQTLVPWRVFSSSRKEGVSSSSRGHKGKYWGALLLQNIHIQIKQLDLYNLHLYLFCLILTLTTSDFFLQWVQVLLRKYYQKLKVWCDPCVSSLPLLNAGFHMVIHMKKGCFIPSDSLASAIMPETTLVDLIWLTQSIWYNIITCFSMNLDQKYRLALFYPSVFFFWSLE